MEASSPKRPVRIFLSSSHADLAEARLIQSELLFRRFDTWSEILDVSEGGTFFADADEALQASDVLILLFSQALVGSNYIYDHALPKALNELRDRSIKLIPLIIDKSRWFPPNSGLSAIHLSDNREQDLNELSKRVSTALKLDLPKIQSADLEKLTADLLAARDFKITRPKNRMSRPDFYAEHKSTDPSGAERRESFVVEVKAYQDQRIDINAVRRLSAYLQGMPDETKGLMVTNGRLTSIVRSYVSEWATKMRREIQVIDGADLTDLLLSHPAVADRYFPLPSVP